MALTPMTVAYPGSIPPPPPPTFMATPYPPQSMVQPYNTPAYYPSVGPIHTGPPPPMIVPAQRYYSNGCCDCSDGCCICSCITALCLTLCCCEDDLCLCCY
ncbi:unnamed protein product [Cunninghamella echinulata]